MYLQWDISEASQSAEHSSEDLFCCLSAAAGSGQDLAHKDAAERQPLQMSPLPEDQELGERHRLQRHAAPQLQQGEASLQFIVDLPPAWFFILCYDENVIL